MTEKKKQLEQWMEEQVQKDICVAFSAGVDSSLLLKMACDAAVKTRKTVYAVTFSTKLHPKADLEKARKDAAVMGAVHLVLEIDERNQEGLMDNPVDRCYLCKKYLFTELLKTAGQVGADCIVEGTNADDLHAYRPGIRAVRELGIQSPLAQFGITKAEVRQMAAELGIEAASRPSSPCLITRLPYHTRVDFAVLEKIGQGEAYLQELGFQDVRLRLHGEILRLEINRESFGKVLEEAEIIVSRMKELGFCYITLDLEGFRSGSMDIGLKTE